MNAKAMLTAVVSGSALLSWAELSSTPYTCHWTGDAKNGNWWDVGNWAEGVVPGVYTVTNAVGLFDTNGCRGCTAVFGRVPNSDLDKRRCIHANHHTFNPDEAGALFSIGHIVIDGATDPEHPDYVLPEYLFSNSLTWQWSEPYLPLEGGGSVELKATVDKGVYFDASLVLGAHETSAQTYRFINNSPAALALHRLTAKIVDNQWSKASADWFSNTIRCEGTGDIALMMNGSIPRSMQEYVWSAAMTGGRLLVRKAYNLGTKAYSNVAAQIFQLRVPADAGTQVLDIEEGCSLAVYCDNSSIADIHSDLRLTGSGAFIVHSGTNANREFYVRDGATVEVACTVTNDTAGTFSGEKAGLRLVSDGGGTFFVTGTNAIPGAVEIGPDIAYQATTIGNVGEQKELGAGQRIQFNDGGLLKYTGAGEYSTKYLMAAGYAGCVWNAGTGDLFFAGVRGGWSDFKITLTNDGVHAIGLTADVVKARPIVAPGALVRFAPGESAATASIDVTNIIVGANATVAIADGTSVRIHGLYRITDSDVVNFTLDESAAAELVIDNLNGFKVPSEEGAAPAWLRVNGRPARFDAAHRLMSVAADDLTIAARGDAIPNAPTKTVAITSPGDGVRDTLAADATSVVLLRNRETSVTPVVELGAGQTLTAVSVESVAGATPIVFTGVGALAAPFNLLNGTVVRSNETTGASFAIDAETETQVSLTGLPADADAPFGVTVSGGRQTLSAAGPLAMNLLRIDGGAEATLAGASLDVTNILRVGETSTGALAIEAGTTVTGVVKVAGSVNATGMLVQNGGDVFTRQANNPLVGYYGHGYYEMNGGRLVNFDGGGAVSVGYQGTAVFAQYGGEVLVTNGTFQVRARDGGYSVFYQKSGLLWQTTSGADLYCCTCGDNGSAAWIIDGADAVTRVWIANGGRNFVLGGTHTSTSETNMNYILAVNDGGTIHAGTIVSRKGHDAKTRALVNFNGGIFRNNYAYGNVFGTPGNQWFDPVDRVTLFEKGMTMCADVDCSTATPLLAPTGRGIASVAWEDTQTAFLGSPAVRIVGDGEGATAVAVYDAATRRVTGIRVTSPGCSYTRATAELLYGNDGAAAKVVAHLACTLADNVSGGFTKTGSGKFRFAATNTYTGATTVEKGTLQLEADDVISAASPLVLNGGTLDLGNHAQTFSDISCNGGTVANGKVTVSGIAIDLDAALAGTVKRIDARYCDLAPNAPVTMRDPAVAELADRHKVVLAEFENGTPASLDLSSVAVPEKWTITLVGSRLLLYRPSGMLMIVR